MTVPTASLPLPPGPVGLPLVGSALHFIGPFGRSPHAVLTRLAGTYGPIVSFRPGTAGDFVAVSSPAAAREALVDNDAALAARFVPDVARARAHSSESLLFLPSSSDLWRQHRAAVGAHLSAGRGLLDGARRVRDRHARGLAARVRARSGAPVKVGEAVLGAVLDVVSGTLFSEDVVGARVRGDHGQPFEDLVAAVLADWTRPNVSDAFPFLAPLDLLGARRRVSRGLTTLYEFLDDEFIERRLAGGVNRSRGDLLDAVLARHAKAELTRSEMTKFFTDHRGMGYGAAVQAPGQDGEGAGRARGEPGVQGLRRGARPGRAPLPPCRGEGDPAAAAAGAAAAPDGGRGRRVARRVLRADGHLRPRQPLGHREGPDGVASA
ncbi:hypothetical protein PVAP13_2KG300700 [Panicum virgatum]|uniref:Cytochrome P450 n=1 Tax=Panicum virgatum TaxID=38727 RepID=A0A8T0W6S5_PANVG|nr:hypothetical protein PVAP13_2KG300700 [Panicum virgatum]